MISDTARLVVGAGAGGTITFHLYSDSGCTTEVTTGLSPVTVNGPGDYNSGNYTTSASDFRGRPPGDVLLDRGVQR